MLGPRLGLPGSSSCTAHTPLADFRHHSPALIPRRREHSTPPVPAPHARSPSHRIRATCSATSITLEQRQHEYSSSPHARRSRPPGRSSYSPPVPVSWRPRPCLLAATQERISPWAGGGGAGCGSMEGRARAQERKAVSVREWKQQAHGATFLTPARGGGMGGDEGRAGGRRAGEDGGVACARGLIATIGAVQVVIPIRSVVDGGRDVVIHVRVDGRARVRDGAVHPGSEEADVKIEDEDGEVYAGVPVRAPLCPQIVADTRRRLSRLTCLQPPALRGQRSGCLWSAPILCAESPPKPLLDPPARAYPWLYSSRGLDGEGEKAVESIEDCSWGSKAKAPEETDV
ncbi:hypothetical protein DFH09DRAFT_1370527 [Mycena vulgaris]|nr:hypothetical protein DFH09DRAFT_1370527 [Mycena vulgaris]